MDEIKLPVHKGDNMACIYDAEGRYICGWKDEGDAEQIVSALNAQQPCQPGGEEFLILSGDELKALKTMTSVDYIVNACGGQLTPTDIAECINGILQSSTNKTAGRIEKLEKACEWARDLYDQLALGPLQAAAKYGPDYTPPTDKEWLEMRGMLEAALGEEKKDG